MARKVTFTVTMYIPDTIHTRDMAEHLHKAIMARSSYWRKEVKKPFLDNSLIIKLLPEIITDRTTRTNHASYVGVETKRIQKEARAAK